MLLFILLGLTVAAEFPPSDQDMKLMSRASCPSFLYSFNGNCHMYVATPELARHQACVSEGANLVSIHGLEENSFVSTLIKNFDPQQPQTWIGLQDAT